VDIDYALIADYADITAGKLYLVGGGWDRVGASAFPAGIRLGVALGVRLAWDETNVPVPVTILVEDDDGAPLARVEANLNVGRPPGLPPGSSQLAQVAANLAISAPKAGGYRLAITVRGPGGEAARSIPFRVTAK
jgi:hypothetical protein